MLKRRTLVGTALSAALAISVLAVPASANGSGAKLVIGHGIPKTAVDICVRDLVNGGGQLEVLSKFKYGKTAKAELPAGTYRVITRAAAGGNCNGKKLISAKVTFTGGEDLSIIATKTKGTPTYQIFNNRAFATAAGHPPVLSIKHAAMIGAADAYVSVLVNENVNVPTSAPPTASGVPKGAQADLEWLDVDTRVGIAKAGKGILAETPFWAIKEGMVNHVVAVGPPKQFRFLRYRTPYDPF